jgi:hypothetical protein
LSKKRAFLQYKKENALNVHIVSKSQIKGGRKNESNRISWAFSERDRVKRGRRRQSGTK